MVIYDKEKKDLYIPKNRHYESVDAAPIFQEGYDAGYERGMEQAEEDCTGGSSIL